MGLAERGLVVAIDKIVKLDHPGVLHEFTWPRDLSDFSQYNLIYGWNGTGKSTISGLFQKLEERMVPDFETTLSIDGRTFRSQDFDNADQEIRVFNRNFIDRNVFHAGGADLPLILILGEESAESQKELTQLQNKIDSQQQLVRGANEEVRLAEKALDEHCVGRAKDIKELLTSEGENPYRFYNKGNYRETAMRLARNEDASNYVLSEQDLERERAIHTASTRGLLEVFEFNVPDLSDYSSIVNSLLAKTATSQTIESLPRPARCCRLGAKGIGVTR